jgi:hypothetical protein
MKQVRRQRSTTSPPLAPAARLCLWPDGIREGAGGGGGADGEGMVTLASGVSASVRASIQAEQASGGRQASGGKVASAAPQTA